MSVPDDRSTQSRDRLPGSSRRTFIRRFAGGLAIAVPALRTLAVGKPAVAETAVPFGSCVNTYVVYEGHYCSTNPLIKTCNGIVGNLGRCIGEYNVYDSGDGSYCYSFTDDEGSCLA